jgi:hypothetical protein
VISVDFRTGEGLIAFPIGNPAKRLVCLVCGAADQPIHVRLPDTWPHLNLFQFKPALTAGVPRVAWMACEKMTQVEVTWARAGSGFTQILKAFVMAFCEQMPVLAVAQLLGVSDDRNWRVPHLI